MELSSRHSWSANRRAWSRSKVRSASSLVSEKRRQLLSLRSCRLRAELVQGGFQVSCDGGGFARFNITARHHVNQLAIAKNGDRGRRGGLAGKIAAGAFCGFGILAGKYGEGIVRMSGILQSQTDRGTHAAGGASTN